MAGLHLVPRRSPDPSAVSLRRPWLDDMADRNVRPPGDKRECLPSRFKLRYPRYRGRRASLRRPEGPEYPRDRKRRNDFRSWRGRNALGIGIARGNAFGPWKGRNTSGSSERGTPPFRGPEASGPPARGIPEAVPPSSPIAGIARGRRLTSSEMIAESLRMPPNATLFGRLLSAGRGPGVVDPGPSAATRRDPRLLAADRGRRAISPSPRRAQYLRGISAPRPEDATALRPPGRRRPRPKGRRSLTRSRPRELSDVADSR